MEIVSNSFDLIPQDYQKWVRNTLIFLSPVILAALAASVDLVPDEATWGAFALYLINVAIDLFRKWISENKYTS